MTFSIEGKTAIVTGASTGIGLAVARHFQAQGANVVAADLNEARLNEALGSAGTEGETGQLRLFGCDLCRKLDVANLISTAIDAFDRVDILVNALRHIVPNDPLAGEEDGLGEMLNRNLLANLRVSQAVARKMIAQTGKEADDNGQSARQAGAIVTVGALSGQKTRPELMGYSIATAALEQATRSLALALAPHRVRVNGVAFGSVMSAHLQGVLKDNPDWRDMIIEGTPLGRIAFASEVADAVQFLASEGSGFITGQIVTVDGGRLLLDPVAVPAH